MAPTNTVFPGRTKILSCRTGYLSGKSQPARKAESLIEEVICPRFVNALRENEGRNQVAAVRAKYLGRGTMAAEMTAITIASATLLATANACAGCAWPCCWGLFLWQCCSCS